MCGSSSSSRAFIDVATPITKPQQLLQKAVSSFSGSVKAPGKVVSPQMLHERSPVPYGCSRNLREMLMARRYCSCLFTWSKLWGCANPVSSLTCRVKGESGEASKPTTLMLVGCCRSWPTSSEASCMFAGPVPRAFRGQRCATWPF